MNIYLYLDRDTFVHRLDPRTKVLLLLASFILAFAFDNPVYTFGVLLFELVIVTLAGAWPNVRRMWKLLVVIAVVTAALFALTTPGDTPLFWIIRRESLLYGISVAFRLDILIIAGLVFLSTTNNEEIALALVRLGVPYRISFAVSTALRLVPTILGTALVITQAQRSRGHDVDSGNIIARVRKFTPIVVPIFISTIRSTQVFAMALESKGFNAGGERTFFLNPRFGSVDVVVTVLSILIVVLAFWARFQGLGIVEGFRG
jgi:energy-coupling factor transport system permease protein